MRLKGIKNMIPAFVNYSKYDDLMLIANILDLGYSSLIKL